MCGMIAVLLGWQPHRLVKIFKDRVERSVRCSLLIVKEDLVFNGGGADEHSTLRTLCKALDKKNAYYTREWSEEDDEALGMP